MKDKRLETVVQLFDLTEPKRSRKVPKDELEKLVETSKVPQPIPCMTPRLKPLK